MSTKHKQKLNPHTKLSSTPTGKSTKTTPTKTAPTKTAPTVVKSAKSTSNKPVKGEQLNVSTSDVEEEETPHTVKHFKRCRYCVFNPKLNKSGKKLANGKIYDISKGKNTYNQHKSRCKKDIAEAKLNLPPGSITNSDTETELVEEELEEESEEELEEELEEDVSTGKELTTEEEINTSSPDDVITVATKRNFVEIGLPGNQGSIKIKYTKLESQEEGEE